jgi:hypothetical protein
MRMKAAVYKQYGEAAIMSLVLEALPKVKQNKTRTYVFLTFSRPNYFLASMV